MKRRWRGGLRRGLLVWHRRIGIAATAFVLLLVVTGILLNHTEALRLDSRMVDSDWLLDWYDIGGDAAPVSFAAGEQWVSGLAGRLYLDGAPVADNAAPLVGAVWQEPAVAAATAEAVYLFMPDGELVEKVFPPGVPGPLRGLAAGADGVLVLGASGGRAYAGDLDLIEWREVLLGEVSWPQPAAAPPDIAAQVTESWRGDGLPWERVLLDAHSGRLFGAFGPWVVDGAAVLFVVLAMSGLFNWALRWW